MKTEPKIKMHDILIDAMLDYVDVAPSDIMTKAFVAAYQQYVSGVSDVWISSTVLKLDLQPKTKQHVFQVDSIVGWKPDAAVVKLYTEPKPEYDTGFLKFPIREEILINCVKNILLDELPNAYTVFTLLHGLLLRALLDNDCTITSMEVNMQDGKTGNLVVRFEHPSTDQLIVVFFDYTTVHRDEITITEMNAAIGDSKTLY